MVEEHESLKEVVKEKKRNLKVREEKIKEEDKRIEDERRSWSGSRSGIRRSLRRGARGFRGFATFSLYFCSASCYQSR